MQRRLRTGQARAQTHCIQRDRTGPGARSAPGSSAGNSGGVTLPGSRWDDRTKRVCCGTWRTTLVFARTTGPRQTSRGRRTHAGVDVESPATLVFNVPANCALHHTCGVRGSLDLNVLFTAQIIPSGQPRIPVHSADRNDRAEARARRAPAAPSAPARVAYGRPTAGRDQPVRDRGSDVLDELGLGIRDSGLVGAGFRGSRA
jgi:hypothetical protein